MQVQGPVSRKSRQLFGPEKPFVKLQSAYSVKLVLSHVVKGIKMNIWRKCRASRSLRFKDTKRIMPPGMHPKSFRIFEKQAPGTCFPKVPKLFGSFSDASIPVISSQRLGSKPSKFTILLVFLTLKTR